MLNEGNQIHNFISSSGSGTVINYGSGSDFLTSYGSGGSVPVPQRCQKEWHCPPNILLKNTDLTHTCEMACEETMKLRLDLASCPSWFRSV